MAKRKMYTNRYVHMHVVCDVLHTIGQGTATDVSKRCNLSRQSINRILKDCITYGYVTYEELPHRPNVTKRLWSVTKWWIGNKTAHMNLVDKYQDTTQLCLL